MQVVGLSVAEYLVEGVAARTARAEVRDWAVRVLRRHVRRERSLLAPVKGARLAAAMDADLLPAAARRRIEAVAGSETVYAPSRRALDAFFSRARDTMDWIESLPSDDRRIRRIDRMSWPDAEKLAEEWHASLARVRSVNADIMAGVSKVMDLEDGAFGAILETEGALRAEGKAMGHCVGGYWKRVSSGSTRIASVRDRNGQPHVTIELTGPAEIAFEDGGMIKVATVPTRGVNELAPVMGSWVAVQIRGKQNSPPVPHWARLTSDFLKASRIPVGTHGNLSWTPSEGGGSVTVATVFGKHFRDLRLTAAFGERKFIADFSKGKKDFDHAYNGCGLAGVHAALEKDVASSFMERLFPHATAALHDRLWKRVPFPVAFAESGLRSCHAVISAGKGQAHAARLVYDAAVGADTESGSSRERVLCALPGEELKVVIHEVPLLPLQVLSAGVATGCEDMAASATHEPLRAVLAEVMRQPGSIHVVTAGAGRTTSDDVVRGFLFCGLGKEYQEAIVAVSARVKETISAIRRAVKHSRPKTAAEQETVNRARNLVADGWEARVLAAISGDLAGKPLVFCPEPLRRVAPLRSVPQEPLKLYRRP